MICGYEKLNCGLIGEHLSHSFSKLIHNRLTDYSYELYELPPEGVEEFVTSSPLDAFNVTIPYKKTVMPYLDFISPEALAIGAVNTVVRRRGKTYGYNTDYFGFSHMIDLSGVDVSGKKALIIGAGGASATAAAVLRDRGAVRLVILNSKQNTPEARSELFDFDIIVNTSPVGMFPNNGISPLSLSELPNCICVYDVIYNPCKTALLLDAESRGIPYINGLPMLVAQAVKAFEYFTGDTCDVSVIEEITSSILAQTLNIVLVGMPGSGKTTVGKLVAEKLSRGFADTDEKFEELYGISPSACITERGEEDFRRLEHLAVCEVGKSSGLVISTGGGVVTREENYAPLAGNGKIFFIERQLSSLSREGRPLSMKTSAEEMYASRISSYRRFSDVTVFNDTTPEKAADKIISEFTRLLNS